MRAGEGGACLPVHAPDVQTGGVGLEACGEGTQVQLLLGGGRLGVRRRPHRRHHALGLHGGGRGGAGLEEALVRCQHGVSGAGWNGWREVRVG